MRPRFRQRWRQFNWLALILAILSWFLLVYLVISFPPATNLLLTAFFLLAFSSLFFSFSFILNHQRRALLLTILLESVLFLLFFQIANFLNLLLLIGLLGVIELYFLKI